MCYFAESRRILFIYVQICSQVSNASKLVVNWIPWMHHRQKETAVFEVIICDYTSWNQKPFIFTWNVIFSILSKVLKIWWQQAGKFWTLSLLARLWWSLSKWSSCNAIIYWRTAKAARGSQSGTCVCVCGWLVVKRLISYRFTVGLEGCNRLE